MGIRQSQHGYSFADQYDIIRSAPIRGLYKLQSRQNRELFTGRQLSCNDELQTYELECIVHQKLSNPSPFVTPLIESKSDIQDSYCSTNNKFYLLFRDVSKVLADEINQRLSQRRPFAQQQIDQVIARVSKGLTYLYNIYHHHGAVSSKSITWPTQSNQSVQLIDEWILPQSQQFKRRVFRPKDEHEMNDKMQEKADDLYHLGLVARQMMRVPDAQNSNRHDRSDIMRKIQTLLASNPMYRFRIYDLVSITNHTNITEVRNVATVLHQPVQHITTQQPAYNIMVSQTPKNNSMPMMTNSTYQPHRKQQIQMATYTRPSVNQYSNFSKQNYVSPMVSSLQESKPARPQISFQPVSNKPVLNLQQSNVRNSFIDNIKFQPKRQKVDARPVSGFATNTRNVQLSGSKPKVNFSSSFDKTISRTSSMGKLEVTALNQQKVHTNTQEKKSNITFVAPQQYNSTNIHQQTNFITSQDNSSVLTKMQAKPLIKFNTSQSQYKYSTSNSNWIVPAVSSSLEPSITPISSFTRQAGQINSSIPSSSLTSQHLIEKYSKIGLNMSVPEPTYSPAPIYSGLNYSFGQSSDQTFSFKAGNSSSSDDNLFTSPDFFSKIKQSGSMSLRQQKQVAPVDSSDPVSFSQNTSPIYTSSAVTLSQNQSMNYPVNTNTGYVESSYTSNISQLPHSILNSYQSPALPLSIKGPNISSDYLEYSERSDGQTAKQSQSRNKITDILDSIENKKPNDVFQNVTNIPIIKSIENPTIHEIYDKIATNQNAYEAPSIVVHGEPKSSQSKEDPKKYDSQEYDYTPGKNSRSNQPFSTIPEVSERSGSVRSDDEKDFVIEEYENGSRYEGFKSNGMRNGKGKFFYQEGSFYDGEWKNNNMHGYGRLYYSNNRLAYEGDWFIDQFHGRGKVYNDEPAPIFGFFDYTNFDNLDEKWKYYQGDLVCDSKEGQGKLLLSNDEYYEGQFRNDKVDGKGKFVTKSGQTIKGIWEDSKLVMKL